MKFTQISLLIAGFCLLTFVACQKDNVFNDSNIVVPESARVGILSSLCGVAP